ncbi:hypothetical protein WJX73_002024 [Symbiochloris irregularis]|uniref:Glycosyltransferase 61 catalytic domain-containing protein n=1 Tax=Symbiochloris irregularis TaxID=706552 RepID=A0AAW1PBB5_9CHLO
MPFRQHGYSTADSAAALRQVVVIASFLCLLGCALARKHELTAEGVEGTQRPKVAVDCHQRGPVHLCRIHNFLYKADTIHGTRWELGMALPFFYTPNFDDTETDVISNSSALAAASGGSESIFLPGPCTVNNAPAWGCPSNAVRVFRSPPEDRARACSQALQYRDPVVLVYRNFPNMMHWLSDQVIPYFFAIDEFGMANETIQIMTLDEVGYHHNFKKIAMMDAVWQKLSGNPVADMADHVRENICAPAAILGGAAHALTQYNIPLQYHEVRRDSPRYQRFAPWLLGKYDLAHASEIPDAKKPRLVLIDRSTEPTRTIVNQDEFMRIASEFTRARLVKFEELNFAEQLKLVSETDILIGVHGIVP